MPEESGPQAYGLRIDGPSHQQFHRVRKIFIIASYSHVGTRPGNRAGPIDGQHRVDVVTTRYPAPHLDHVLVVPTELHRARGEHRYSVHFTAETREHRTRAAYVYELTIVLDDGPRPVFRYVDLARHYRFIVDCGILRTPPCVVPLGGTHPQERFLRALPVGGSGRGIEHQGEPQCRHPEGADHAQFK